MTTDHSDVDLDYRIVFSQDSGKGLNPKNSSKPPIVPIASHLVGSSPSANATISNIRPSAPIVASANASPAQGPEKLLSNLGRVALDGSSEGRSLPPIASDKSVFERSEIDLGATEKMLIKQLEKAFIDGNQRDLIECLQALNEHPASVSTVVSILDGRIAMQSQSRVSLSWEMGRIQEDRNFTRLRISEKHHLIEDKGSTTVTIGSDGPLVAYSKEYSNGLPNYMAPLVAFERISSRLYSQTNTVVNIESSPEATIHSKAEFEPKRENNNPAKTVVFNTRTMNKTAESSEVRPPRTVTVIDSQAIIASVQEVKVLLASSRNGDKQVAVQDADRAIELADQLALAHPRLAEATSFQMKRISQADAVWQEAYGPVELWFGTLSQDEKRDIPSDEVASNPKTFMDWMEKNAPLAVLNSFVASSSIADQCTHERATLLALESVASLPAETRISLADLLLAYEGLRAKSQALELLTEALIRNSELAYNTTAPGQLNFTILSNLVQAGNDSKFARILNTLGVDPANFGAG